MGMGNLYTHPTQPYLVPFNFFNEIRMRIILNKMGGIGMGLPVLNLLGCHPS